MMTGPNRSISLRSFPFPFRAGLSICSDIDACDKTTFIAVHRFLNSEQHGLGLPVADSFFGVGREPDQLAFFENDGSTPSENAAFIRQAIEDGLIDSIHTWGDFNSAPPDPAFLRQVAQNLTEDFEGRHLKIRIWINHGDHFNRQNISARLWPEYKGDDPQGSYYTVDLLKKVGVKFFWRSELTPWPLSGNLKFKSPRIWPRLALNELKNAAKVMLGKKKRIRTAAEITELAMPVSLADGYKCFAFTRFHQHPGGVWGCNPDRHTLHQTLTDSVVDTIIKQEGFVIVYTHLGLPYNVKKEHPFPKQDRQALALLADRWNSGHIWVAPTIDLLTFWFVQKYLKWRVHTKSDRHIITLESMQDPTWGARSPEERELAGVCFYTPDPHNTSLMLDGRQLKTIIHKPDHTGSASIGLPLAPSPKSDLLD